MRALWFSVTPSLFDEKKYGGWIASLERAVTKYSPETELGIAFEYPDSRFKVCKDNDNVTYYPIEISNTIKDRLIEKRDTDFKWNRLKPKMLAIIEDFRPDIIQCFGSEWPFGRIAESVDVPVVIHMQGFSNIYSESSAIAFSEREYIRCSHYSPKVAFTSLTNHKKDKAHLEAEKRVMASNHYFMGRTKWDRDIVRYFSPDAKYFYCPEALRPEIYDSSTRWKMKGDHKLVTITQAGMLKGNEMILRTAKILKEQFSFDFQWNVAGNLGTFHLAEVKTGIRHEDYNINLLGMIDASSVAKELAESLMYIHPAIIDNSPNSLCEAQLIGCPVIAANVGGIPSLVEDGKTGMLYPYSEPYALAFLIMDLCGDQEKLEKLSENEICCARERHNPEQLIQILNDNYQMIVRDFKK